MMADWWSCPTFLSAFMSPLWTKWMNKSTLFLLLSLEMWSVRIKGTNICTPQITWKMAAALLSKMDICGYVVYNVGKVLESPTIFTEAQMLHICMFSITLCFNSVILSPSVYSRAPLPVRFSWIYSLKHIQTAFIVAVPTASSLSGNITAALRCRIHIQPERTTAVAPETNLHLLFNGHKLSKKMPALNINQKTVSTLMIVTILLYIIL